MKKSRPGSGCGKTASATDSAQMRLGPKPEKESSAKGIVASVVGSDALITTGIARFWRRGLVLLFVVGSLLLLLALQPIPQPQEYHNFADQRMLLGMPNFANVASNAFFLFVGIAGLTFCSRKGFARVGVTWAAFFAALALVSLGSAYYHWRPDNATLVWDRLPMAAGFMAMFVAILSELIDGRLGRLLLAPALIAGFSSVIYWHFSDDLRLYAWVQFMPLLTIPVVMVLFRSRYSHSWLLFLALCCYVLAKVFEVFDRSIFALTNNLVAGHAIKHLLAALGCFVILEMLKRRKALPICPRAHPPPKNVTGNEHRLDGRSGD